MKEVAALVPMRGQSVRVPRKNLRSFCGKPLFWHVLDSLRQATLVKSIYVDTDSDDIAREVTKEFDVNIIHRPQHLWGDDVPMTEILKHDVEQIDAPVFLQTHSTNPLLRAETIDRAIELFFSDTASESLVSVTPVQKRFFFKDRRPINHDPKQLLRTQDLEPIYEENSCIYIFTKPFLLRTGLRFDSNSTFFEMDAIEATDIDTETDFILAENLFRIVKSS